MANINILKYRDKQRKDARQPLLDAYYSIPPNVINSDTTLQLVGDQIEGYSKFIFENLTWILENFSGETPPSKAVKGQIWHRLFSGNPIGQLYLYTGEDFRDGGDSTDLVNWAPLTEDLEGLLTQHIADTNNPHQVTKAQVGLGNVDNVPVFDKTLNLSDLVNNVPARSNLSLYGTSEVYNKVETGNTFLNKTAPANNTLLLGNQLYTTYVKSASPVITRYLDMTTVDGTSTAKKTLLLINNGKQSLSINDGISNLAFLSGIDNANNIIQNNDSGIRISFKTEGVAPEWKLTTYNQSTTGPATLAKTFTLNTTNLYVDSYQVFNTNYKPTPAQIGAYATNDIVSNSLLLNGFSSSVSLLNSTVVERDSSGNIFANGLKISNSLQFNPTSSSNVVFRNDSSSDAKLRLSSAQTTYNWINPAVGSQPQAIISHGSFIGNSGAVNFATGVTISKLGTGQFRATFNSPRASSSYCVVLGEIDDGALYNRGEVTGALSILKGWITNISAASFDINIKEISSTFYTSGVQHWHQYYSHYKDFSGNITFFVYDI